MICEEFFAMRLPTCTTSVWSRSAWLGLRGRSAVVESVVMSGRHVAFLVLIVLVALAGVVVVYKPARAQSGNHGDGHAQNHDWYRELKTKSGWSCCNGDEGHGDCRPAQARQRFDGQWEAYYGGTWQEIPADAILRDELNRVPLHAHICERAGFVYCFLRGGGGS